MSLEAFNSLGTFFIGLGFLIIIMIIAIEELIDHKIKKNQKISTKKIIDEVEQNQSGCLDISEQNVKIAIDMFSKFLDQSNQLKENYHELQKKYEQLKKKYDVEEGDNGRN